MTQPSTQKNLPWLGLATLLIVAASSLAADLWTKRIAVERLSPPERPYEFLPGLLHFTYVANHGAVFGLGQGYRWLFVLVSFAAIAFVGYLFAKSPRRWWYDLTLGMLLAGILGNLYDRIFIGHVRDMIHALPHWPNFFPWVFNVADSLLCVSIVILMVAGFFLPEDSPNAPDTPRD